MIFSKDSNDFQSLNIENSIRVMSYNIQLKDCEENNPKDCLWEVRKKYVASMIRFHSMDLIGLQESTHEQLDDLTLLLSEYSWFAKNLDDGGNKSVPINAVLFLKKRFEILESSFFYLSSNPEEIY